MTANIEVLLAQVADKLAGVNRRIDAFELTKDTNKRAIEAARLVRADAARERRREAERADEAERQERYRQRRVKDHEDGKFTKTQQIFNDALSGWGRTAPAPGSDESYYPYLRRCISAAQSFLPADHTYGAHKYDFEDRSQTPTEVLSLLGDKVLAGAKAALYDPTTVKKGGMREIVLRNDDTGAVTERRFVGQDCFVKAMGRPGRRVTSFLGGYDSSGMPFPRRY
jgi:hypothetical protein